MTRSERLMYLVQMLKAKRRVSVEQLSSACQVSQRTIYRDMATLSKMNIPVYYDNGYRLARDTGFPLMELGIEDLELICYCLRNNPLAEFPFFARRFRLIERKVTEKMQQRTGCDQQLFVVDHEAPIGRAPETPLLERFLRAVVEGRRIEVVSNHRGRQAVNWIPLAIRVKRDGTYLVIARGFTDTPEEVSLRDLRTLKLSDMRFDRLQADATRRNWARHKKELTHAHE